MTDKTPAQIEADGDETVIVKWDDIEITIPASPEDLDLDAIEALENGKGITFLRHLMGAVRYEQVKREWQKENGRKPRPDDVAPFLEDVAKVYGFDSAGN